MHDARAKQRPRHAARFTEGTSYAKPLTVFGHARAALTGPLVQRGSLEPAADREAAGDRRRLGVTAQIGVERWAEAEKEMIDRVKHERHE